MEFRILKGGESANDSLGIEAYKCHQTKFITLDIPTNKKDAVFGMVLSGKVFGYVEDKSNAIVRLKEASENCFFSGNFDALTITPGTTVCLIKNPNFKTVWLTGEVEPQGRLKYIDGAFNSLLMSPPKKGDPCLNALYMAGKIDQTPHTHPSTRIGFILRGQVTVRIWDKEGEGANVTNELLLTQGDAWFMEQDTIHSFHTTETDDMCLFAFHPDSDFGPTDEEAPMINRTMIQGESSKGENEPAKRRKEKVN